MASQDKVSEKVQLAIFSQLLSTPANSECGDCNSRNPTWVSLDFGVFVCMRCSGVHRQLGPHISRVRSVKLDGWTKGNLEIMAKVGNKVANDYYEHKMPTGYRKPGSNSSPEECRKFVDEKYIRKAFVPTGYQEPVKELIASRKNGSDPDFGYSQQKQNKQPEPVQPVVEAEPKSQSAFKFIRKKSMSLDRVNESHQEKKPVQHNQHNQHSHHHQDLLTPEVDLLGSDPVPTEKLETHSASPVKKINFASFKKAQSQPPGMHHSNSQPDHVNVGWELEASQPANNSTTSQPQPQPQSQSQENKVDLMKLYSQPQGHQNHFMSGMPGLEQWLE
jgi:stromal membrane-associated protein